MNKITITGSVQSNNCPTLPGSLFITPEKVIGALCTRKKKRTEGAPCAAWLTMACHYAFRILFSSVSARTTLREASEYSPFIRDAATSMLLACTLLTTFPAIR
jgi:hypothetical protein